MSREEPTPPGTTGNDILPMQGLQSPPAFEGRSDQSHHPLYWEHEGNRAMRDGKWKLVAKYPEGKWELYDIDADRTEMHDLASVDPDRARTMEANWEAWAKQTHVLPWPWKPQYNSVPTAQGNQSDQGNPNVFELKQGDDLRGDKLPQAMNKSISIEAKISKSSDNGVIVAQGGLNEGYSLYIKSGQAHFAIRREKKLTVITAKEPLPDAPFSLSANLSSEGLMKTCDQPFRRRHGKSRRHAHEDSRGWPSGGSGFESSRGRL